MLKYLVYREEREDGFSLVELLVVIVIIGILSAIAIGAFMNQREKANEAALKSDLRNAGTAVQGWQASGNGKEEFAEKAGTLPNTYVRKAMFVIGEGADHALTVVEGEDTHGVAGSVLWNNSFPNDAIYASDGVVMEIIIRDEVTEGLHLSDEGAFCIAGNAVNTEYDFQAGGFNPPSPTDSFLRTMFYDSELGGVIPGPELMEHPDGEVGACAVHVSRYKQNFG